MAKKLRAAVIGCGAIAQHLHVPDYANCPQAEIVALCDTAPQNAKALAEAWAPEAAIYTDHQNMLKEESIDCVTITLPNRFHAPVTLDALRAGCHVLVEKPMATTLAEAKKMVRTAKKMKRKLLVNHTQRLFPIHIKAKKILDSGILGKVLHINAMYGHGGPENWSATGKWFFDKKEAAFGVMGDLGIHKADLLRYLTGKEVKEIFAYTACLEKKKSSVDDNFASCLTFDDGSLATLSASWTVKAKTIDAMTIHCQNGSLHIDAGREKSLTATLAKPARTISYKIPSPKPKYKNAWGFDVSGHFVRACLEKEEPFCSAEEGLKSLAIILAADKAARTGRPVKLSR